MTRTPTHSSPPVASSAPASAATGRGADLASLWAVAGVAALFALAVLRLGREGILTILGGLGAAHWVALVGITAVFVYGEGYRALDRRWVPDLFRRARALRAERRALVRVLAPLHGLSLIAASRGRLLRAWGGTLAITGAVVLVRGLPAPWRGIVDFAVAAALAWGLVAIVRRLPEGLREDPGSQAPRPAGPARPTAHGATPE